MNRPFLIAALLLATLPALAATPPQPRAAGVESEQYRWNKFDQDLRDALKSTPDLEKGKVAYEICRGCHKADGSGKPDDGYPQLAGQHPSVLIKQMLDVRKGKRDNPKMHPFIEQSAVPVEDIPNVAAYLNSLPVPTTNRKGAGTRLEHGKELYLKDCASCHGRNGEGHATRFYPKVVGQHYTYLYRESIDIRDKTRRNANPKMIKALAKYSNEDVEAVSDYMSRMAPSSAATPVQK